MGGHSRPFGVCVKGRVCSQRGRAQPTIWGVCAKVGYVPNVGGHGFSHAAKLTKTPWALAPEGDELALRLVTFTTPAPCKNRKERGTPGRICDVEWHA